ncbi:Nuclear pore complex protein Nup98-Nup96, partial [Nosema granulosis]
MNQNNNSLNNIFKSGMFTSTPQKEPTPSPFGSSQSNANVFGAPQQTFGSSNIFQPTQQTPFGQQNTNSSFGTSFFTTPKPQGNVFGALGSSGAVQPLPAPTNSFGAQPATSTGFGTASNPFGSSTAFGSTPTPTTNTFGTSNTFGSTTPFGTTTGTFGSAPTSTSTFGTNTAQNQTGWTTPSTFGSTTPSSFSAFQTNNLSIGSMKNGTRDTPYQDTRVKDGIGSIDIKHINAMNEYLRKSNDELRNEDYNLGRKAITSGNQPSATNSVFGSTPFSSTGNNMGVNISSSTNPFSNAQPSSTPFSTPFNTTTSSTPFNTTTSSTPFNTTTTSTPFNTTTNNTTTSTTPFNTTTNTNTIPFGITSNPFNNTQTAPSPFAVPGNTPQQPFASSTPQSSNPFGTSSQSTTFSNNSTLNS